MRIARLRGRAHEHRADRHRFTSAARPGRCNSAMANHRPAAASRTARIGARPPPCARTTDPPARRPRGAPGAVWRDSLGAAEDEGQPAGRPCASHVQDRPRSVCAPRHGIHTASPTLRWGGDRGLEVQLQCLAEICDRFRTRSILACHLYPRARATNHSPSRQTSASA